MSIRVGTLVILHDEGDWGVRANSCVAHEMDKADICLGKVIALNQLDEDEWHLKVYWLQICLYHLDTHPTVEWYNSDELWEVGQLA